MSEEKCECGKYTLADWDCCNDCLVGQMNKVTDALKKIANTEYCEVTGCCQDTDAKLCRKCLANVALKALGKEEHSDKTMCQKCQVDRESCPNL